MRKYLLIFLSFLILSMPAVFSETTQSGEPIPLVQFSLCNKSFAKPAEPIFYLVLSAITKYNYKVEEIQSKNGLILFKAENKEFLANITKIDNQTSLIKITPADNNYRFHYNIVDNIFQSVTTDLNTNIYKLN